MKKKIILKLCKRILAGALAFVMAAGSLPAALNVQAETFVKVDGAADVFAKVSANSIEEPENEGNIALGKPVTATHERADSLGAPGGGYAAHITDGLSETYWDGIEWAYNPEAVIDLEGKYTIDRINVLCYVSENRYYLYDIYASNDGVEWTQILNKTSTLAGTDAGDTFTFEDLTASYLKIVGTYNSSNEGFHVKEVRVYGEEVEKPDVPVVEPADKTALEAAIEAARELEAQDYVTEGWLVFADAFAAAVAVVEDEEATQEAVDAALAALNAAVDALVEVPEVDPEEPTDPSDASLDIPTSVYYTRAGASWNATSRAIDGDETTHWQTHWQMVTNNNRTDLLWYQVELPEDIEVQAVRYLPLYSEGYGNHNGFIQEYKILVSADGENWTEVTTGTWEIEGGWKIAEFDATTTRFVRLLATKTYTNVIDEIDMRIVEFRVKGTSVYVDTRALKEAIAAVADLVAKDYTEESWAAVEAALEAANTVLADEEKTQEAVDAAAEALVAAVEALVEETDPSDASLDVPVDMYKTTAGSTYNSTSYALDGSESTHWEVQWDIGATEPEKLWYQIELADDVEVQAVRYLPRWGSETGDQNGFIEAYKIMVSTDGETWTEAAAGEWEFESGWKIAEFDATTVKYVRLVATSTYSDIDGDFGDEGEVSSNMAIAEIRVKATGTVINRAALKEAIAAAEGLAAEDYKNFDVITDPLAAAKEAIAAETQEEVDAAAAALNEAIASLVKIVKKDALIASIEDAKEVDQELYTSATAKAFADAIAAGEALAADEEATQEAVDAAVAAIAAAKAALVAKATAEEKAALQEVIDAAEAMDKTEYTEESAAALEKAITDAKAVLDNADATAKNLEDAAAALQAAIDALEVPVVEEVVRLFGSGRYETGYAVADALKEVLGVEKFEAVVVATGKNFADALAGSYLAVEKNAAILLTNGKDDNIAQLHAYIKENVVEGGKVYILGGEAAVPAAVEAMEGYDVVRLFGDSRYDTNLAILEEAGVAGDSIIVATGKTFADSLSASAAKLPILLVKPNAALNDAQKEILADMKNIYIVGGEGAVSAAYAEELAAYGEVTRVFGDSRYDTSVEIAKTFCTDADKAVVASGKNFPDGLCGGPLAAALNAPLVLTKDGGAAAAAGYVADNAIASGYVLGGEGALANETVVEVFGLESAGEIK